MSVLVVIVNYGTAPMTLRSAEAAVAAARQLDGSWSLVIVDNKSPDDSVAVLRAGIAAHLAAGAPGWDRVSLLESDHNGGFGAGNNLAIRPALASADPPRYVYLLNSDAFPVDGALVALQAYMDAHPEVGVAGSRTVGTDGTPHTTAFRFPSIASEFEDAMRLGLVSSLFGRWRVPIEGLTRTSRVDWVAGASMMIRSTVLREVGLFDEVFFLYFEETELCQRIQRAGWQTAFVAESLVHHVGGASTGINRFNRRRLPEYWLDSRYYYFLRSHGYAYLVACTLVRLLGLAVWQVRRFVQRKEDSHPPRMATDLVRHFFGRGDRLRAVAPRVS